MKKLSYWLLCVSFFSFQLLKAQESKTIRYSTPALRGNILLYSDRLQYFHPIAHSQNVQYFGINFNDVLMSQSKEEVLAHAQESLAWINNVRGKYNPYRKQIGLPELTPEKLNDHITWEYFYARKWLPLRVSSVLVDQELDFLKDKARPVSIDLITRPVRAYPEFQMAQHVIGRFNPASSADWIKDGPITEEQLVVPKQKASRTWVTDEFGNQKVQQLGTGLEASMAELLDSGTPQIVEKTFHFENKVLKRIDEKVVQESKPGASIVLTMDYELQKIAEEIVHDQYLKKIGSKSYSIQTQGKSLPKAFVLIDLNDMSIAAMASSPSFDLQRLSPGFGEDDYVGILKSMKNPDGGLLRPLDSRAFEMSFPPASTFKMITALAGLETGTITAQTQYPCTYYETIGNRKFHNHEDEKKVLGLASDPYYNFSQAIKRSCNTWFYQMILEMNKDPQKMQRLFDIAKALGLGIAPDLPIPGMAKGFMYDDIQKIKNEDASTRVGLYPGEAANMAIGQGPLLASPLQIAWMSARLARPDSSKALKIIKDIYYDTHQAPESYEQYLSKKGKSLSVTPLNQIVSNYHLSLIQNAMYTVVNGANGTAWRVKSDLSYGNLGPAVAAKTGTGQWGTDKRVAWLTGFMPFHAPKYAFAMFIEGKEGLVLSGGGDAAPYVNAFFSDPVVVQKVQSHVQNANVFIARMPDDQLAPPVLRAVPVFEDPLPSSPYMQEVNPQDYVKPKRGFFRRLFGGNRN